MLNLDGKSSQLVSTDLAKFSIVLFIQLGKFIFSLNELTINHELIRAG